MLGKDAMNLVACHGGRDRRCRIQELKAVERVPEFSGPPYLPSYSVAALLAERPASRTSGEMAVKC